MSKFSLVLLVALLTLTGLAMAESYRWVDDEGNVNYSQRPPADSRPVETIKPPPPPPPGEAEKARADLEGRLEASEAAGKALQGSAEKAEEERQLAAANKQNCENTRKNIATMKSRPQNTLYNTASGGYKRLTSEEWEAKMAKSEKFLKDYCQ